MKKVLLLLLLLSTVTQAQEKTGIDSKKNEFRVDVLSALVWQKASFSYERFFGGAFSTGFNLNFSDSGKLNDDFERGYRNNVPKFEINPYIRYQLSKGKTSFYFAEVFASYNGGDYKEIVRLTDENINGYYTTKK